MTITDVIARKRDGKELTADEIAAMVTGFVDGTVSEGQMAALLMAIVINGMGARECADLTLAMVNTGEQLDLSAIRGIKVDKHSTGGVGDKTTLVVAPLVAALGVPVAKMSGRALGHTGGTADKLEAIPGFTVDIPPERFVSQVARIGVAIAAQSARMAPADRKIYALRDQTATVESIPLIASSVMSKKLAAGADAIVLDVKAGRGAFMADLDSARKLARTMVDIGLHHGKRMVALVTWMEQPLGRAVGDAVELVEAIETLSGGGPPDLVELCETLAAHMLVVGGAARDVQDGLRHAREGLQSRIGVAKLRQVVIAQGGDPEVIDDPARVLGGTQQVPVTLDVRGIVTGIDAREIGAAVRDLKDSVLDMKHSCGVILRRKVGDAYEPGDAAASVILPAGTRDLAQRICRRIGAAYRVGDSAPPAREVVAATIAT